MLIEIAKVLLAIAGICFVVVYIRVSRNSAPLLPTRQDVPEPTPMTNAERDAIMRKYDKLGSLADLI